ncbi:MAG: hypothetical protein HPY52_11195 [Firmicutes bacterium]|nr:hypothetical protein [Bacillota bacterium]
MLWDDLPVSYDSWRTACPDEAPVAAMCAECGREIYAAERVYAMEDGYVHKRCIKKYAPNLAEEDLEDLEDRLTEAEIQEWDPEEDDELW